MYVVLTSIFVTCLIIADVIGVKLFEIPLPFEILGHKVRSTALATPVHAPYHTTPAGPFLASPRVPPIPLGPLLASLDCGQTVEHTCGMIIFPVTFVLGDVINEYYGPKVPLPPRPFSLAPCPRPFSQAFRQTRTPLTLLVTVRRRLPSAPCTSASPCPCWSSPS